MKKFLAFALVIVMCMFTFASCADADDVLGEADDALLAAPYKMNIKMNYSTEHEEFKEIFNAMNVNVPVIVDGNNMLIDVSMDVLGESVKTKMTLIENILYYDMDVNGEKIKMKSALEKDAYDEFLEEQGVSMPAEYTDFDEIELKKEKDKMTVTCQGLSDQALKDIKNLINDGLEGVNAKIDVNNIKFTITLKDKKYESIKLSCTYTIVIEDKSFEVAMSFETEFVYTDVPKVSAPADADDYTSMNDIVPGI